MKLDIQLKAKAHPFGTNFLALLLLVLIMPAVSHAQDFEWAKHFDGEGIGLGLGVVTDNEGYVYVTGYFTGVFQHAGEPHKLVSKGERDIFIVKYHPNGNVLWVRRAGGKGHDEGRDIAINADGNLILTGYFSEKAKFGLGGQSELLVSEGAGDIFVAGYSTDGDFLWVTSFGLETHEEGRAISGSTDGSIAVAGYGGATLSLLSDNLYSWDLENPELDYSIALKFDGKGGFIWAHRAGSEGFDKAEGIKIDDEGNVFVAGLFFNQLLFGNGGLVIGGVGRTSFIAKYASNGDFEWGRPFGGIGADVTWDLDLDGDGNPHITGIYNGQFMLAKFFSNGIFGWLTTMPANFTGYSLEVDHEGNSYVGGVIGADITLAKFRQQELDWIVEESGAGGDVALGVALNGEGGVYATGVFPLDVTFAVGTPDETSFEGGGVFAAKYHDLSWMPTAGNFLRDQLVPRQLEETGETPATFSIDQNYPNPFNPTTTLRFHLAEAGDARLDVYDVTGKLINTLVQRYMESGVYEVQWNGTDASGRGVTSGIYLYRLQQNGLSVTGRMSLLQ